MLLEERFWSKVKKTEACWLWTGATDRAGYGRIYVTVAPYTTRGRLAHRIAYELATGQPLPPSVVLHHRCHMKLCVNPGHLETMTRGENIARSWIDERPLERVTHCPQGHPYEGDNLILTPDGCKHCRECGRARARAYARRKQARLVAERGPYVRPRKTHCKHGHEFTPSNTYLFHRSDGGVTQTCRECARLYQAKRRRLLADRAI